MKIALSNIAWDRAEDADVARLMQQHGVTGLDVAPGKLFVDPLHAADADITAYVDFWKPYGVQIVGMQSMLYGHLELKLFESAEARQQMAEYLRAIIALAGKLGVGPMVFGSPKNRQRGDMDPQTAFDIAATFFHEMAEVAQAHDTVLCLEPNPPHYNCDFLTTTAEALPLVQAVNHPGLRLHLDTAIMTMNGEDIAGALRSARDWLAHFHISEPQLGAVQAGGAVDHAHVAAQLRAIGYEGWVSIEMRGGWTQPDADSVAAALAFVTETYGGQA